MSETTRIRGVIGRPRQPDPKLRRDYRVEVHLTEAEVEALNQIMVPFESLSSVIGRVLLTRARER